MEFYQRPNSYDISFELLLETVGCEDGYLYYSRNGSLVVEKIVTVKDQMLVCKSGFCADPRLLDANIQRRLREHFVDSHKKVEKMNFLEKHGLRIRKNAEILTLKYLESDFDNNLVKVSLGDSVFELNLDQINLETQKQYYIDDKKQELQMICSDAFGLVDKIMQNPFDRQNIDALRLDFANYILDEQMLEFIKKDPRYNILYEFLVDFEAILKADFFDLRKFIRCVISLVSRRSHFRGMPIFNVMNDFLERIYPKLDLIMYQSKMRSVPRGFNYLNLKSLCSVFSENYRHLDSQSKDAFVDCFSENLYSIINGFDISSIVDDQSISESQKAIAFVFKILESRLGSLLYFPEAKQNELKRLYQDLQMRQIAITNYSLWDLPAENLIGKTNQEIIFLTSEISKALPNAANNVA